MIVDSSALMAILLDENDAAEFVDALVEARASRISAVNFAESSVAIESRTGTAAGLDALLRHARIEIAPVTVEQAYAARQAYADYAKGRHAAGLNLGDCFAYALAKVSGEPLLFKGGDFARTDVTPAR